MTKRRSPLPDKWERKFRNGCVLDPPKGHKVGIYWGDLLKLEYYLRDTEENLAATARTMQKNLEESDNLEDMDDGFHLALARDTVRNIEFILATIRRTGKPPAADHPDWPHQQVVYAGAASGAAANGISEDDEIPF